MVPQPQIRIEFIRIFIPIAIIGFFCIRLLYGWEWLSTEGFKVPPIEAKDYRQPLYLAPLPLWATWGLCIVTLVSGLTLSLGFKTTWSGAIFAATLTYLALADRLGAFTVTKLAPVVVFALTLAPAGRTYSLDALLRKKHNQTLPKQPGGWGGIRFLQALVIVLYTSSGIAKARGDWLHHPYVLWTHLHDSYQTIISYWTAYVVPGWGWTVFQALVLIYEAGAFLWFTNTRSRKYALIFGLGMHGFIALGFGPVKWFGLFMIVLILGCFAPTHWLENIIRPRDLFNKIPTTPIKN